MLNEMKVIQDFTRHSKWNRRQDGKVTKYAPLQFTAHIHLLHNLHRNACYCFTSGVNVDRIQLKGLPKCSVFLEKPL